METPGQHLRFDRRAVTGLIIIVLVLIFYLLGVVYPAKAVPGDQSFLSLQPGFTQELVGVDSGFMGGVAFADDGDPIVTACTDSGSSLRRFDLSAGPLIVNTSALAPMSRVTSNAGCGLTGHPNGSLYSNLGVGVIRLDAETGTVLNGPFGSGGNALGITVNPLSGMIVYVGSDGTLYEVDPDLKSSRTITTELKGKFLDGIYFSPSGRYIFTANRTDFAVSIIDVLDGSLVQTVMIGHEPDGIAFHASEPQFVVTVNIDGGTMSRLDFPRNDFTVQPLVSDFATGGFRGDLAAVGPDGCLYLTQDGVRYANGSTASDNSLVRICGGFSADAGTFLDRDGDALLDDWEENGLDFDNDGSIDIDLPAMGADPDVKDIFVEIDWIETRPPDPAALAMAVDAFANAPVPIALHIDVGPRSIMREDGTRWGDRSGGAPLNIQGSFGSANSRFYDWSEFDRVKIQNFEAARRDVFHYVVYAGAHPGNSNILGIARGIPSSDFIVFTNAVGQDRVVEAVNFVHELGHNLDLRHGGSDNTNHKPNYLSVMNYFFSIRGLVRDNMSQGVVDYSRAELEVLDENTLQESEGLTVVSGESPLGVLRTRYSCPSSSNAEVATGGSIDWNCTGNEDGGTVASDINQDRQNSRLPGYDDWSNLRFNGGVLGANEAIATSPQFSEVDADFDREVLEALVERPFALVSTVTISPIAIRAGGMSTVEVGFRSEGEFDDSVVVGATVDIRGVSVSVDPESRLIAAGEVGSIAVRLTATSASNGSGYLWVEVTSQTDPSEVLSWVAPVDVVSSAEACPSVPEPFTDVSAASFAKADIECIYGLGVTLGTSATTFSPSSNVTRRQMASFLARTVRSVGVTCPTTSLPFTDVSAASSAKADIECVYGLELMNSTSATTFSPSSNVTRRQMASFLARTVRSVGVTCPTTSLPFTDVSGDLSIRTDIACVYGLGITRGTSTTTFSPLSNVTRAQMAVFLASTWRIMSSRT